MTGQNAQRDVAPIAVLFGFGAVFATLITLVAFEPHAGSWISAATEAEMAYHSPVHEAMTVTEPKRRPIGPGRWAEVLPAKMADARPR
jgi:hypothetical protein